MPDEQKPRPHDSEELRASIKRLSEHSERLRESAKKNAEEAEEISQRIRDIERHLAESESLDAKKCGGCNSN